jgi:integrase/recombinase xerC
VEIAQVEVGDVYEGADGWDLFVRGKGGRTRTVPITADLAQAIITRCATTGQYAFPGRCSGHMAANSVSQIGRRVLPGTWTLHKLRHRYATKAYSAEHDLLIVRELLGHASLQTTVRYIAPSPRARDAVLDATRVQSPVSPNSPILPAPPA